MATIKTAISIPESLFREVDLLAKKMKISRSELVAKSMQWFLENQKNRNIWEELNQAYSDSPNIHEKKRQNQVKTHHRKLVEGEW